MTVVSRFILDVTKIWDQIFRIFLRSLLVTTKHTFVYLLNLAINFEFNVDILEVYLQILSI